MPLRKKYLRLILPLKLLILALAVAYIYIEVFKNEEFEKLLSRFSAVFRQKNAVPILEVTGVLLFLNWGLESLKWKTIIQPISRIPFLKSFQATIAGSTLSLFTPNRIGGLLGRVIFLPVGKRAEAGFVSVLGNISQLLVTLVMGAVGATFVLSSHQIAGIDSRLSAGLIGLSGLLVVATLFFYFNSGILISIIERVPYLKNYAHRAQVLNSCKRSTLLKVLLLSFFRYFVFCTQFLLLLYLFNVKMNVFWGYAFISCIYLVSTIIPTVVLGELGIRESVAVHLLTPFSLVSFDVFAASFTLWCINLLLPALTGSILLLIKRISF